MKKNQIFSPVLKVLPVACCIFFLTPVVAQTDSASSNWSSYNRTYEGDRYSPLKQINTTNIKQLHLLHSFEFGKDIGRLQTAPVLVDGVMYFTTDSITYAIGEVPIYAVFE